MKQTKMKKGFTLAEVLITLGVIGIVAAMTIPTLVNNYQKKVFATKGKQMYAVLANVLASSIVVNGSPNVWYLGEQYGGDTKNDKNDDITYIVNTYFKPYLKITKDIGFKDDGYHIVLNNGISLSFFTDGNMNGDAVIPMVIYIVASLNKSNTTAIADKSRDYSRHDIVYSIRKNDNFLSLFNVSDNTREGIISSRYGCSKNIPKNERFNCGALLQYDGWEIKDDYPW